MQILPPIVYVPCAEPVTPDRELVLDARTTKDGRTALLAYTALDRLVSCCGEEQPWVPLQSHELEAYREAPGFDLLLLDVEIPTQFRRSSSS